MKKLLLWLSIVAFPIALAASTSQAQGPQATYRQDSITPWTCDWPQKGKDDVTGWWCGAACLQANVEWDWRDHRGDTTHYYAQSSYWNHMRDDSCSDVYSKDAHGRDIPLSGTVGNRSTEVRELNIAYDFGTDPHALAWTMWEWGPDYYHYWVYDTFEEATRWLLWTVEYYHEPVIVAVNGGSHWVLVIGYEAERSATHPDGPGTIHEIGYADPWDSGYGVCDDYTWVLYDTGPNNWAETFTPYTHPNDPDPETGWYGYYPRNHGQHWYGHYVTIERDWGGLSPDWGRSPSGLIPPYPWRAEYLSHATPTTMEKGKTYTVRVTLRNTGSEDWPSGDPNTSGVVSLAYHWVQRGHATNPIYEYSAGMVTWEGLRTSLPYDVADASGVTLYA